MEIIMKKILSLAFVSTFLYSQDYFNLELDNTGVSQLIIFQNSITSLEPGDEIGIFDPSGITNSGDCSSQTDELLVGSGIWSGDQLEIVNIGSVDNCAFGGFQLPGYQDGNSVVIKVYRASEETEYTATATYAAGTGTFGDLFMAISEVEVIGSDSGDGDITDGCDLPLDNLYLGADGAVLYNASTEIGGFQFTVEGASASGGSGGDSGSAGFVVSAGGSTVLGFSFTGASFGPGCGTMVNLNLDGDATGLSGIVMSDPAGNALDFEYYEGGGSVDLCEDESACNTGAEGDCEYPEENFDCDGACIVDTDCAGVCGGSAELDECGVCDGDGIADGACDCDGNVDLGCGCGEPAAQENFDCDGQCIVATDCAGECGGSAELDVCGVCMVLVFQMATVTVMAMLI